MKNLLTFESFISEFMNEKMDTKYLADYNVIHAMIAQESVNEKKVDGTISDDEAEREEGLMAKAEVAIDDLIAAIKKEANEIGGSFRSPGIESRVAKLLKSKLQKARLL